MDDPSPTGLSRRALLRNGLLVGLGATAAVTALPELAGMALAENSNQYVTVYYNDEPTITNLSQPDWWYCVQCYGIFHSDDDTPNGVCPYNGGKHQNNTSYYNYCTQFGGSSEGPDLGGSGVQSGWRWCSKCQGLFWGSAATDSYCPAGGQHIVTSDTYTYVLVFGTPTIAWTNAQGSSYTVAAQSGWLYCGKCRGLFYGHGTNSGGWCPAGSHHLQASNSYNYEMIPDPAIDTSVLTPING